MSARRTGSVRFDPYFKIQVWRDTYNGKPLRSWMDIQQTYATEEAAREAFPLGERCRLMRVTMDGREVVPE